MGCLLPRYSIGGRVSPRVNETNETYRPMPRTFHIAVCRLHGRPDSWPSKSNRRSVPDLSWATFRRGQLLSLSNSPCSLSITVHTGPRTR